MQTQVSVCIIHSETHRSHSKTQLQPPRHRIPRTVIICRSRQPHVLEPGKSMCPNMCTDIRSLKSLHTHTRKHEFFGNLHVIRIFIACLYVTSDVAICFYAVQIPQFFSFDSRRCHRYLERVFLSSRLCSCMCAWFAFFSRV